MSNHHPGNEWYRRLIKSNRPLYRACPKHTKLLVAKAIVQAVEQQSGRFLERDRKTGMWHSVPYKRAVDKTSQGLREKERDDEHEEEPIRISELPATMTELARAMSQHEPPPKQTRLDSVMGLDNKFRDESNKLSGIPTKFNSTSAPAANSTITSQIMPGVRNPLTGIPQVPHGNGIASASGLAGLANMSTPSPFLVNQQIGNQQQANSMPIASHTGMPIQAQEMQKSQTQRLSLFQKQRQAMSQAQHRHSEQADSIRETTQILLQRQQADLKKRLSAVTAKEPPLQLRQSSMFRLINGPEVVGNSIASTDQGKPPSATGEETPVALTRFTSQVSEWLNSFWPLEEGKQGSSNPRKRKATAEATTDHSRPKLRKAVAPAPPLTDSTSQTLLQYATSSKLFRGLSSLFAGQDSSHTNSKVAAAAIPADPSTQGAKRSKNSLLDDYEETEMEAQFRQVQ